MDNRKNNCFMLSQIDMYIVKNALLWYKDFCDEQTCNPMRAEKIESLIFEIEALEKDFTRRRYEDFLND